MKMTPTGLIQVDLWNRATWKATGFGSGGDEPPVLALLYEAGGAAQQIFRVLRKDLGVTDAKGFLRIAVVMDDRHGPPTHYFVHVGPSEKLIDAAVANAKIVREDFLVLARVNEMCVTSATAGHMGAFREHFAKFGKFNLVPGVIRVGGEVSLFTKLGITMEKVHFRVASEILNNRDPDWCLVARSSGPPTDPSLN